jgi:hypothetical protein
LILIILILASLYTVEQVVERRNWAGLMVLLCQHAQVQVLLQMGSLDEAEEVRGLKKSNPFPPKY